MVSRQSFLYNFSGDTSLHLHGCRQPVYVSLAMTSIQIVIFLAIFEFGRRSRLFGGIYEKRRQIYPDRTPPPLPQKGVSSWFFSWWRVKLSKPSIGEVSGGTKQHHQRPMYSKGIRHSHQVMSDFLKQADDKCYRDSPFYDPSSEEDPPEISKKENITATAPTCSHCDCDLIDEDQEVRDEVIELTEDRTAPQPNMEPQSVSVIEEGPHSPSIPRRVRFNQRAGTYGSVAESSVSGDKNANAPTSETSLAGRLRRRILMNGTNTSAHSSAGEDSTGEMTHHDKIHHRILSDEEQELLNFIGLDSFMTLRFLRFAFDATFFPLLLSAVTLVPIYFTATNNIRGFFSVTAVALSDGNSRHWALVFFGFVQFCYIFRRLWIEWEIFLPLRYEYLEKGSTSKEFYEEQYRRTCVVEYIPKKFRTDQSLYAFFNSLFPGQIVRAEVLLNTEYLRMLLDDRQKYIVKYEDAYAKKVSDYAKYLLTKDELTKADCCHKARYPKEPKDPEVVVMHMMDAEDTGNAFMRHIQTAKVKDPRTHNAFCWYHHEIQRLNKEIDDEYIRLSMAQRRPVPERVNETYISKWLGLKHLTGRYSGRLHSKTAFVEFRTLAAKQQAIQCNITGTARLITVNPVPDLREIIWSNMHVPASLIETRRLYANICLVGCLVAWSFLVVAIRSFDRVGDWFGVESPFLVTFFTLYVPALLIEGLVRIIPLLLKLLCKKIRFKSTSDCERYILRWYFSFRFITFIFVIAGGTLTEFGVDFIDDPVGFSKTLSDSVAEQSAFYTSYVLVAGGLQMFLRLSQAHNCLIYWLIRRESSACSERRLEQTSRQIKMFHLDEFVPLFLFIFMVGSMYGAIAPVACVFVALFYRVAYKVFKFLSTYVYGSGYAGGGFVFYILNNILFFILYFTLVVVAGYLSLHGSGSMAGIYSILLVVTIAVQRAIHFNFVEPSRTLALKAACASDRKAGLSAAKTEDEEDGSDISMGLQVDGTFSTNCDDANFEAAVFEKRYGNRDAVSDMTDISGDFFVYRQPSLNRSTWEVAPRPYRRPNDCCDFDYCFW